MALQQRAITAPSIPFHINFTVERWRDTVSFSLWREGEGGGGGGGGGRGDAMLMAQDPQPGRKHSTCYLWISSENSGEFDPLPH